MRTLITLLLLIAFVSCTNKKYYGSEDDYEVAKVDTFMASHNKSILNDPVSLYTKLDSMAYSFLPGDSTAYFFCQFYKAKCLYYQSRDDEALSLCNKVINYCLNKDNSNKNVARLQILSYNFKGIFYQIRNKRDSSILFMKDAYDLSIKSNYKNETPDICINLADVYRQKGNLVNSAIWYHRALSHCDTLQIDKSRHSILAGLGLVYADLNNFDMSQFYFDQAENKYRPKNDYERYFLYNSRGNAYYFEGKYDDALKYFRLSYREAQKTKILSTKAIVESNMAEIFTLTNKFDSAHLYLDKAKSFFNKPETDSSIIFYLNGLYAGLALKENKLKVAAKYLDFKCDSAKIGKSYWYIHCKRLSEYYSKIGDSDKAFKYLTKSMAYDDSLRNIKNKNNISELQYRYEHDNTLLKKNIEIAESQKKEDRLWVAIFFSISITLLLLFIFTTVYLRVRQKAEKNRKKQVIKIMELKVLNAKNRLSPHFLFNILNVLLPTASYDSNQRKTIDGLIRYLRANLTTSTLSSTLKEEIDMVRLYIDLRETSSSNVPEVVWDIKDQNLLDTKIPSMIIQVPVENAIKYAFQDFKKTEDKITITISNTIEGNTSIEIRDNGIGIASKSTRKSAIYEGTHNGLSLIHKMIDMLNSKNDNKISFTITDLSTISEDEHGTVICFIIPTIYRFD